MSAYGVISLAKRPLEPLPSTLWLCKPKNTDNSPSEPSENINVPYLTIHHLTLPTAYAHPDLIPYLHATFEEVLQHGMTYPQEVIQGEPYTQSMFESYFFGGDVLVAIVGNDAFAVGKADGSEVFMGLDEARNGRSWKDCIAGFYYVKPNYPGRSSHICNAGFVVPSSQRAKGFGSVLARSYLHYGPSLGYEASVFNLVFVNNVASVKLWDGLNFTRAGLIPRAGRLKKADGSGEEYVDAIVFYKRFDTPEESSAPKSSEPQKTAPVQLITDN
ncbi:Mitochondrial N-acetyltransferase [Abortiporus biennis]